MKILLLAGHGYINKKGIQDRGAMNKKFNVSEIDLNRTLISMIMNEVKGKHQIVTFDRDVDYKYLPKKCNDLNPDIIVEFHHNAAGSASAVGNEVLYYGRSSRGKKLASIFNAVLFNVLNIKDRGIKAINSTKERGGLLLKTTNAPCIIVESAFLSSNKDTSNFLSKMNVLAKTIAAQIDAIQ